MHDPINNLFVWLLFLLKTILLKRLCERGIFKNENGIVSSLMTKAEFGAAQSEKFVEDTFEGSLPAFLAAFTTRKKLSKAEIDEIRQMIDSFEEE